MRRAPLSERPEHDESADVTLICSACQRKLLSTYWQVRSRGKLVRVCSIDCIQTLAPIPMSW